MPTPVRALVAALTLGAAAAFTAPTLAGEAVLEGPHWRAEGFAAPESVLVDGARDRLIVSNIAGSPGEKDGTGYLSRVAMDGEVRERKWVTGLDAPKGMALVGDTLYVSDIDRIHAVDVTSGTVTATHSVDGAKFLNDAAADGDGRVYVSDMMTHTIYRLADGKVTTLLQDERLHHPNGLMVKGDTLMVASWGAGMRKDFTTEKPGSLLRVSLNGDTLRVAPDGAKLGNLDGLVHTAGQTLITDWMAGKVIRVAGDDTQQASQDLPSGSADLGAGDGRVYIPLMKDDEVVSYSVR